MTRYFSIDKARRHLGYSPKVRWDDDSWDEILASYGLRTRRQTKKEPGRKDINANIRKKRKHV